MKHPIYIVDDDYAIRRSTKFLLGQLNRVNRAFVSGNDFLQKLDGLEPGVVLLDLRMPGRDGLEVQQEMISQRRNFPIIMVTGHGDVVHAVRAMKAGAVDFLEKPFAPSDLHRALANADHRLKGEVLSLRNAEHARSRLAKLTPRERDVLKGLAEGYPNKTIAYDLGISPRTVEVHRAHLMEKLGARNLADVLRLSFAIEMALDDTSRDSTQFSALL